MLVWHGRMIGRKLFAGLAGVVSGDIAKKYEDFVKKAGFGDYYLYGPCHGLGMIEVEKPWLETVSTYAVLRK